MKSKKKLCRTYISQIKSFFPVITKNERNFIKRISKSVNEYCEDNPTATLDDLYELFGSPYETISSYIITSDNFLPYFKKIRIAKWIKHVALVLIATILFLSVILYRNIQEEHKIFEEEKIGIYEETIE